MPPSAPAPQTIAQYEIIRRLGAGGMAEVFVAKKRGAESTYKVVVLKRILPTYGASRRFQSMFIDEALLATRLNHPNVVQVYEFSNEGDEGHVLAMEYVEGADLGMLMSSAKNADGRIPPWVAAWIIAEAAKGLHYAHERKDESGASLEIVHRDVSPQNILLSYEGVVKIADFGIASARLVEEEAGVLKGKFGYMSPEQARGEKVDRRGDLYSLGVILWECLTGRALHGGLGGEALLDIVRSGTVEPPSTYVREIPDELESIVMKLLAAKPEDRFPSGRELASAIGRALLQKQELVDAQTLEATIAKYISRETSAEDGDDNGSADPDLLTQAAAPRARASTGPEGGSEAPPRRASAPPQSRRPQEPREVRHIVLATLRFVPREPPTPAARIALVRALEPFRTMLGEMAYKRGMRWVWKNDFEATAIAGLAARSTRAPSDAAWLALETHEAVAGFEDDLPSPLGVSISIVRGIASGTRDPEGNLVKYVLHDPVMQLAEVLSEKTPVGATWVAGGVYRLVRREFRWGDAPTLDLTTDSKIENAPPTMRIYALDRSLSRDEREAELLGAPSDLVGRDAEKAELHAAFHAAVAGGGAVTCRAVLGEQGIGKTALVGTFAAELPPNVRLFRVESSPVQMEVPFSSVAELIRAITGITGDEPFDQVAETIARVGGGSAQGDASNPMVARLAELATNRQGKKGEDEDAHYQRKLVVSGVRHLLAAIAIDQPVVLIVEGMKWTDRPSLELLAELTKNPYPLPILILLVTRPDDRLAQILHGMVRIELHGLTTLEQIRLVETRLGVKEGVREVTAELMPRVGGNPFYLLEMVDALLERGLLEIRDDVLVRPEGREKDFQSLPSTLEQLLADRLSELPEGERKIVDWLAIAGGPLSSSDLWALASFVSVKAKDEALMGLSARGLIDRKGEAIDFRHPLTRDVAYAALDPKIRPQMHASLGAHLAKTSHARGLPAAIIARHFAKGDQGDRAADFYLEAANSARLGYQTQLAIRYYMKALAHLDKSDVRKLHSHEALESLFRMLGRRRDRVRHLDALRRCARRIGTPRAACLALLRTARFDLDEGKLSRGLPLAKQAAQVSHTSSFGDVEIEAELLVSELSRELGDVQGALAASDRALAASNPTVNSHVPARFRADTLRSRGVLLRRVGRTKEAVDAYVESIAIYRHAGAMRQEARAKNALAFAMCVQGRYEDAIALALESIQIDLAIGGRFQLAKTLSNIGLSYSCLGDTARAQAYLARAREAHERYGDQDGRADTYIVSADVALEMGDVEAADTYLRDAIALSQVTKNAYDTTHALVVNAALARFRRDFSTAISCSVEARRNAEQQALVAYHFYAFAIEASARVDAGEVHAATLLANTALGAVETLQGCEYGLEIRVLCADALKRAGSPQAPTARQRAVDYATSLLFSIRDGRLRRNFAERPIVAALFDRTPVPKSSSDQGPKPSSPQSSPQSSRGH